MLSPYTATEFLNYLFKGINADASDSRYIGLFDAAPNSTGSNEVTTDYFSDRIGIGGFLNAEIVGTQLIKKNDGAFTFDTSIAASASPITHFGLFDASVGGNFLGGWEFVVPDRSTATSFSFGSGDSLNFAAEDLQIIFEMTNWTQATMTKLANWMCEATDLGTAPTSNWVGLFSNWNGGGDFEITDTVAAGRFEIPSSGWSAITAVGDYFQIQATNNINFGTTLDSADLSYVAVFDDETAGDPVVFGSTPTQSLVTGQSLVIAANKFKVSLQ